MLSFSSGMQSKIGHPIAAGLFDSTLSLSTEATHLELIQGCDQFLPSQNRNKRWLQESNRNFLSVRIGRQVRWTHWPGCMQKNERFNTRERAWSPFWSRKWVLKRPQNAQERRWYIARDSQSLLSCCRKMFCEYSNVCGRQTSERNSLHEAHSRRWEDVSDEVWPWDVPQASDLMIASFSGAHMIAPRRHNTQSFETDE